MLQLPPTAAESKSTAIDSLPGRVSPCIKFLLHVRQNKVWILIQTRVSAAKVKNNVSINEPLDLTWWSALNQLSILYRAKNKCDVWGEQKEKRFDTLDEQLELKSEAVPSWFSCVRASLSPFLCHSVNVSTYYDQERRMFYLWHLTIWLK